MTNKVKTLFMLCLLSLSLAANAVPAQRRWVRMQQADGTFVEVMLRGDEHGHAYVSRSGSYMQLHADGRLYPMDASAVSRLKKASAQRKRLPGKPSHYTGEKRGLFILVDFQDVKFSTDTIRAVYERLCNARQLEDTLYQGSVRDYFYEQSDGKFDFSFDIVGPVTLEHPESYYGANGGWSVDSDVRQFAIDAINLAAPQVNPADYDWDGDSIVDHVFLLYAGYGEAQYGPEWTIWPCAGSISQGNISRECPVFNGIRFDTFACGCELHGNEGTQIDGIGTICHEFSHCMGLPDFYDTQESSNFCMDAFDVMDQGVYNGDSYCPAAFTGYERWFCGWREPVELKEYTEITGWKPLVEGGATYILYNDGYRDEYYLLDNRERTGFDSKLYSTGLVVTHVDYDAEAWASNNLNTDPKHLRMGLVPADNIKDLKTCNTDAYPYTYLNGQRTLDSLTNNSYPAATLFHKNADGSKWLSKPVYKIKKYADQTVSFRFLSNPETDAICVPRVEEPEAPCYDLAGRRVYNPRRGIYIRKGKKVWVL